MKKQALLEYFNLLALVTWLLFAGNCAQAEEQALSDKQIKTLRTTSQALLRGRLAEKERRFEESVEARQQLNTLNDIIEELEWKLVHDKFTVKIRKSPMVSGGSGVSVQPSATTQYRFQPDTQSFVAAPSTETVTPASAKMSPAPDFVLQTKSLKSTTVSSRQKFISAARIGLAALKAELKKQQPAGQAYSLLRQQSALGFANFNSNQEISSKRNSLLLQLTDDAEAMVQSISDDDTRALEKVRRLKKRLSLQTRGMRLPEAEPTVINATNHRTQ